MTKKQKRELAFLLLCGGLYALAIVTDNVWFYYLAYGVVGATIFAESIRGVFHAQMLDENFLMTIASLGAIYVGEYSEAIAVLLFYRVGTFFEHYAVNNSRDSISSLLSIRADYATKLVDGQEVEVEPEDLQLGDIIVVKAGEKIPVDSRIIKGSSSLDTSALTGESLPRLANEGEDVISGSVNLDGLLTLEVTSLYEDSTVAKILELVEVSASRKANVEKFITKFAKYYTPIVVALAASLIVIPTLIYGISGIDTWIYRAMVFLVISCPCALVISVPLSLFAGVGSASKAGILVKGSNYLEEIAKINTMAFDKTGTITTGRFSIDKVLPANGIKETDLLTAAYVCESKSNHPLAKAVTGECKLKLDAMAISTDTLIPTEYTEKSGKGITCTFEGKTFGCGNSKLMEDLGIDVDSNISSKTGSIIHLSASEQYLGSMILSDTLRPEAKESLAELKAEGIKNLVMLTGDSQAAAREIASEVGIDTVKSQLLPAGKVDAVEGILADSKNHLAFVGDGINDAPVLARANVGIAMGAFGSDAAIEAADIVIMADDLRLLPKLFKISKKTMAICRANIVFALGVKAIILALGALGIASMWVAVFGDVGVSVIAILNSMRALRMGSK